MWTEVDCPVHNSYESKFNGRCQINFLDNQATGRKSKLYMRTKNREVLYRREIRDATLVMSVCHEPGTEII